MDIKLVGLVQLYPIFSSLSMSNAWLINDLYVVPEARNNGIGTMLLDTAIQ